MLHGDFVNLCDADVSICDYSNDIEYRFSQYLLDHGLVMVVDAEGDFVCFAREKQAELLVKLINEHEPEPGPFEDEDEGE